MANFLAYIEKGHFRDTIFHRVIPGFMIQGGGFAAPSPDLSIEKQQQGDADEENAAILMGPEKPTRPPIKNESTNFLRNDRGTIAMARTSHPDSATAQFFINLNDNAFLNRRTNPPGYAVFGKVIGGMPVVDAIARVKTGQFQGHGDVPLQPVIIRNVALKSGG